eukprot:Amastigsp_a2149_233.p1 type:complete len:380 gc:universal Amastigsp_a2149_233:34-1173(+)
MANEIISVARSITCHAWNGDCSKLALCQNNSVVEIYGNQGGNWVLEHKLSEHTQTVSGIAWAPTRNTIVTCGHDRNAYVWEFNAGENKWEPTLVILRINRGATKVQWCLAENKFAVSSGAKCIAVCYFDPDNNWWVSKHCKRFLSTCTSIAWHPNSYLLAAGSTDFKTRIFSAAIKGVDKKPSPTPWGSNFAWGEVLAEFDHGTSWVHDVKFSPSGAKLGFVTHDSSVVVIEGEGGFTSVTRVQGLPYTSLIFATENTIFAGGHDCNVSVLTGANGRPWTFQCVLDQKNNKKAGGADASAASAARNKFQQSDSKGTTEGEDVDTTLPTIHQNAIRELMPMTWNQSNAVTAFSSAGSDGLIVSWTLSDFTGKVPGFAVVQ